jgi:ribA/ribD-fused uncharacterized protein
MAYGPGEAKRIGRAVTLRPDWEAVKDRVMWTGLVAKFSQHRDIRQLLVGTGLAILIEGNYWHDNYWGDCVCERCSEIPGKNMLGEELMMLREAYSAKTEVFGNG